MTPEDEVVRANEVKHLLENPYLKSALEEIESALLEQIIACPLEKQGLLNEMVHVLRCKRKFVEILFSHIETGKMARIQQDQDERRGMLEKLIKGKAWT